MAFFKPTKHSKPAPAPTPAQHPQHQHAGKSATPKHAPKKPGETVVESAEAAAPATPAAAPATPAVAPFVARVAGVADAPPVVAAPKLTDAERAKLQAGPPVVVPTTDEVLAQGYAPDAAAQIVAEQQALSLVQQQVPRYRITAIPEAGFWRIKRKFMRAPVEIPVSKLTKDEIKLLTEPCAQLNVALIDG